MSKAEFEQVVERLKVALDVATEKDIAERLGFAQSAWATRKMRGSVPKVEINNLLKSEGINPEFIYNGTGNVHAIDDRDPWEASFGKRAEVMGLNDGWLFSRGHGMKLIADLLRPVPGTQVHSTLAVLRDARLVKQADLNWLFTAQTPAQADSLDRDETALIRAYRAATNEGQRYILQSARMAGGDAEAPHASGHMPMDKAVGKFQQGPADPDIEDDVPKERPRQRQ